MKQFQCRRCSQIFESDAERSGCIRCGGDVQEIKAPEDTLEIVPRFKKSPVQRWQNGELVSTTKRSPETVEQESTNKYERRSRPTSPYGQKAVPLPEEGFPFGGTRAAEPTPVDDTPPAQLIDDDETCSEEETLEYIMEELQARLVNDPEFLAAFIAAAAADGRFRAPAPAIDLMRIAQRITVQHGDALAARVSRMIADIVLLEHGSTFIHATAKKVWQSIHSDPAWLVNRLAEDGRFRGPAGQDGRDGRDGRDGAKGKDGKDGARGVPGRRGAPAPLWPIKAMAVFVALFLLVFLFTRFGSHETDGSKMTGANEVPVAVPCDVGERVETLLVKGLDRKSAQESAVKVCQQLHSGYTDRQ